jgi:hypothetical protein
VSRTDLVEALIYARAARKVLCMPFEPHPHWEIVDQLSTAMTEPERRLVGRILALDWDEKVRKAAQSDQVVVVDFRGGSARLSTISRKRAATVSPGLGEQPVIVAGELWAAWLIAGDGRAQVQMRMSVYRVAGEA